MSKASSKIKEEFEALLPPTISFFVSLHLVALVRTIMFEGTGKTLVTSASVTVAERVWTHFWAIQIMQLILIVMYCTMRDFGRVLGGDNVRRMFFRPLEAAQAP